MGLDEGPRPQVGQTAPETAAPDAGIAWAGATVHS